MSRADCPAAEKHLENRPDTAGRKRGATALPVLGAAADKGAPARAPGKSRKKAAKAPVVSFVSLGCAKNLVDSEMMLGQIAASGAVISGDESLADTVVVNTCGFLESSRLEALDVIEELAARKRAGDLKRIVVAGCLVQRDGESLLEAAPDIDALVGVNNRDDIVQAVWRMDRDAEVDQYMGDYHRFETHPWQDRGRLRLTPRHYAYVRISEGCNQKCTFCTIPSIRGPMRSKSADELVEEARELVDDGAREILLIGQDTTSYGGDIGDAAGLAGLLRRLDRDVAADWIRLMYVYPSIMTDEMIDAIAQCERVVKYIDIPLQHINDRMLKRMHRRVTRKQTETLLKRLRDRIPGVSIRTTFIVGFPGETDAEFDELVDFVRGAGFDAAGAFVYSLEPETPAGRMREQIDDETKRERHERLMLAQQDVALEAARAWIGRAFGMIVDGRDADSRLIARHAGQAPEVDAVCIAPKAPKKLKAGDIVRAKCVETDGYDLIVEPAK
ncbi:MAG: 30S ribosomal protein S12 methylthiotransferase RimO [Phycisphaerales bacterium]|nr:30S ribosomal protein S12 methylthiotransferase RimO [Phycisphaerales bacterium]